MNKSGTDVILTAFDSEIEASERCELIVKNSSEPAMTPVKSNFGRFVKGRSSALGTIRRKICELYVLQTKATQRTVYYNNRY